MPTVPFLLLLTAAAFPDFQSPAGLQLTGAARLANGALRLTPALRNLAGAAWLAEKQRVISGFDTTFQFRLTAQGGLGHGADGLAFVLQNSGPDALGGRGSGGGFSLEDANYPPGSKGIPQSIAVFFDTYQNDEIGDPSGNFVTICTAGTPAQIHWPPSRLAYVKKLAVKLKDQKVHAARIAYQAPVLTIYLDNRRVLASTVDLSTVTGPDGAAWVGFTASTGSGFENHDILSWSFTRPEVSSDMSVISSSISFVKTACLPGRNLCTPDHAIVEETTPGMYHVVLPGNLEGRASIPNPSRSPVAIGNARGILCRNVETLGREGCAGPEALVQTTSGGRTWFSLQATGERAAYEGYLEFDAQIR